MVRGKKATLITSKRVKPLFTAFCFWVPRTCIPWAPPNFIKQQLPRLQISDCVQQRFLCAYFHLFANQSVIVFVVGFPMHPVDLQQSRVWPVVPFGHASDVAVLVDDVATCPVWTSAWFAKNDFTQFFKMFGFPPGFGCQFWQPTDVSVRENYWFFRTRRWVKAVCWRGYLNNAWCCFLVRFWCYCSSDGRQKSQSINSGYQKCCFAYQKIVLRFWDRSRVSCARLCQVFLYV